MQMSFPPPSTMGFLAVAGCMLLASAMSAALTTKPSKA